MSLDSHHFQRVEVVDIDAAVVGIGTTNWCAVRAEEATEEAAQAIMREERFDILPIIGPGNIVTEYFHSLTWNDFSEVQRSVVTFKDVLPLKTHVGDVIERFSRDGRQFFFLANERRIAGLISIAHLNGRHTRVYLYSLISELELRLGELVERSLSIDDILEACGKEDVSHRYHADKEKGVDVSVAQYLYLSDLLSLIAKKQLFGVLGFPSRKKFESAFNSLNEFRNCIAHPNRQIIANVQSVTDLATKIGVVQEALFRFQQYERSHDR